VKHRGVAALGLVGLVPIGLGLVQGRLALETAAVRAVILLALLTAIEVLVLPLLTSILGPPQRREADAP
jgi:hypothetical protein